MLYKTILQSTCLRTIGAQIRTGKIWSKDWHTRKFPWEPAAKSKSCEPNTKVASGCVTWSKSARRNDRRSTFCRRNRTETRKNRCCNRPYKWTSDSLFIKAMPAWLRLKLMEQTTATPNDDVCNLLRRQITIRELYWKEDYWDVGFNEIVEYVSEKLINALSKITTAQQALKNRFMDLDRRLESELWDHQTIAAVQEYATPNLNQKFQNQHTEHTSGNYCPNYRGNQKEEIFRT